MTNQIIMQALEEIPLISAGDDLVDIIVQALAANNITPGHGDVLVLAQKIVSKSENCVVNLKQVVASQKALDLARQVDKDPRLVEVILSQSKSVIRQVQGVLITEHKRGWIMANAGVDASNVASQVGEDNILLLPDDPDASCRQLRSALWQRLGVHIAVVINDSFGRPWRLGTTGVALGAAGLPSLWDLRGCEDLFGRPMLSSQQAIADEVAAAASLLQGQAAEGRPIVILKGLQFEASIAPPESPAAALIRPINEDLFR